MQCRSLGSQGVKLGEDRQRRVPVVQGALDGPGCGVNSIEEMEATRLQPSIPRRLRSGNRSLGALLCFVESTLEEPRGCVAGMERSSGAVPAGRVGPYWAERYILPRSPHDEASALAEVDRLERHGPRGPSSHSALSAAPP